MTVKQLITELQQMIDRQSISSLAEIKYIDPESGDDVDFIINRRYISRSLVVLEPEN